MDALGWGDVLSTHGFQRASVMARWNSDGMVELPRLEVVVLCHANCRTRIVVHNEGQRVSTPRFFDPVGGSLGSSSSFRGCASRPLSTIFCRSAMASETTTPTEADWYEWLRRSLRQ